ncbi:hypothetical protein D3C86_1376100 [compost metagenome]
MLMGCSRILEGLSCQVCGAVASKLELGFCEERLRTTPIERSGSLVRGAIRPFRFARDTISASVRGLRASARINCAASR